MKISKKLLSIFTISTVCGFVVLFQNCSHGSSDSSPNMNTDTSGGNSNNGPAQSYSIACLMSGAPGIWHSDSSLYGDTLTIDNNCAAASTYCAANFQINMFGANQNCGSISGYGESCGAGSMTVSSSNGNSGCMLVGSSAYNNCQFTVYTPGSSSGTHKLIIDCGFGPNTYSR